MKILDVCAGIGAFSYAAKQVDNGSFYTTVGCSEICTFSNRVLDKEGYELFGDVSKIGVPEQYHPDKRYIDNDLVPCEESEFSSITYEDILEGIVDFDLLIAGFPCQDISTANLGNDVGIDGSKSTIVYEVMRLVEDFEPEIVLLENTSALIRKGLHVLLQLFDRLGYVVEWQTISAANFGYSHYRHRTFIVAYHKGSTLHRSPNRIFDLVSNDAKLTPGDKVPLPINMTDEEREFTRVIDTRAIKLRTKRINAIGNSVVVDVAVSILKAIADIHKASNERPLKTKRKIKRQEVIGYITQEGIEDDVNHSLFDISSPITKLPPAGYLEDSIVYNGGIDNRLNPKRTEYQGMFSTIFNRDGNNNCSTASRANRPGKLGGIIGDLIVMFGFNEGGLNPNFGESMLGLPRDYTNIF